MLTGSVIKPKSGSVKKLAVLLHGYGSNANDLAWGLRRLSTLFPDTAFVAPNAPTPCERQQTRCDTYQWFSLSVTSIDHFGELIHQALPTLLEFIQQQLDLFELKEENLVLGGFSQGAMMSIGAALSLPRPCAGVLAYSGAFAMGSNFKVRSRPPMLLVHGKNDTVVPFELMSQTKELLERHCINVQTVACEGVAHTVSLRGFTAGKQFIQNIFSEQKGIQYGAQ